VDILSQKGDFCMRVAYRLCVKVYPQKKGEGTDGVHNLIYEITKTRDKIYYM
jgi:hypothetical protein